MRYIKQLILIVLQDTSNVMGVMVLNNEGFPIRSNLDNTSTVQYGHMIADICVKVNNMIALYSPQVVMLCLQAKSIVRDLDPTNNLSFFRLKSTTHEVLVAPEENFIILVLQHNNTESK